MEEEIDGKIEEPSTDVDEVVITQNEEEETGIGEESPDGEDIDVPVEDTVETSTKDIRDTEIRE